MDVWKWFAQGSLGKERRRRRFAKRLSLESLEPRQLLSVNVVTYHNDLTRQGLNSSETALTPADVSSSTFGKVANFAVNGQIYAEPLYVSNLAIPGQGTHNVVFVATENNDVYAFDANSTSAAGGGTLWHVSLNLYSPTSTATAAATPNAFFGTRYNNGQYTDIMPQVGITSTPVIDLATNTMYIDAFTNDVPGTNAYSHHIWALDITTGLQKTAPVLVAASIQGSGIDNVGGIVTFKASQELQRPALTIVNGVLYVAYSGYADTDPYHGWVLGFNASNLQLVSVLNTTPNAAVPADSNQGEGGIWQGGDGFASDGTRLYVMTGNGDFQPAVGDYGDSFLEITPDGSTQPANKTGYGLSVTDYFTPFNEQTLANADTDLGSGGVMFLPDQPGPHPHLLIGTGKGGTIYVIDRDNMGHNSSSTDAVVQKVNLGQGAFDTPAYFNNTIYYTASGGVLKAYRLTNGALSAAPIGQGSTSFPFPGATPSISSNGNANGIVWEIQYNSSHSILRAYNATPSGSALTELFNSSQNVARDQLGAGVKFAVPMVADGHVFVGTTGALAVYGLLSPPNTAPSAPTNLTAVSPATVALQVVLSWVDTANNEGAFKIERSTDNVNFAQIDVASANATTYTDTTVASGTTYYYRVRATNIAGDSGYTLAASATPMALTSPVDLYHFDEGVGTTAADSIGTNTGTLVGGTQPAWVAGRLGAGALSFSGTGAYNQSNQSAVQVASNLATTLGSTSTLDVWVKTTQVGSNTHSQAPAITGVDQTSSANDIDWGTLNASGQIGIFVGDAGTNNGGGIYSINPINDGLWHNIAMTRDAVTGIVQLYVDGVLNGAGGFDTGSKSSPFALIGALSVINSSNVLTGATYFNGQLDEVRIYNRVLAPTEIADIGQIPSAPSGLVASPYSGSIVQLAWLNVSNFSQNIEVQRKTGAGGTYQQIAVLNGDATTYNDIDLDAGTQYYYRVRAIDLAGSSAFSNEANATPPRPTIVGRYTFYNESSFDQYGGSSFIGRGLAIATDKSPLLPGQTATFQNYTSYAKGLNGVMIDVANFEGVITPDDFTILVGNGSDTSLWQPAPTADIAMRAGFGVGGSTRMEIVWDDNDIENEWVQVTLKADAVTKLAAPDVFYFGNVIGDSGNSTTIAADDSADELAARAHGTGLTAAPITSPYDFNRDGHVDTGDQLTARANAGGPVLQLIVAPAAGGGAVSLIADPTGSVPQNMVAAATSPTSGRGPLVDAALEAFNLAAAIPTAGFKSPLVETSFVSRHRTLIDEALLTDLAARQSERTHFQHPLSDHAWHSANDAGAEQAPSQCDPADPGTDTSLAADLFAGKIQRRQARRIGGGA